MKVDVRTRWPDDHPVLNPAPERLVDRIAAVYPIPEPGQGRRFRSVFPYCAWGAVGRWFGWNLTNERPYSDETQKASGGRLSLDDIASVMRANDGDYPTEKVWDLVQKALDAAGIKE